ncbi:hypothetical protein AT864_00844 [Anoxybacillus sp. P3H1B]|nr:hypothetical protein AT864_00844 [Anoxybacillus sp. P3H1B]
MAAYAGAEAIKNFIIWAYETGKQWRPTKKVPKTLSKERWQHIKERHFPNYPMKEGKGNLFPTNVWSEGVIKNKILEIANASYLPEFHDATYKNRAYRFAPVFYKGYACVIKVVYYKQAGKIITAFL